MDHPSAADLSARVSADGPDLPHNGPSAAARDSYGDSLEVPDLRTWRFGRRRVTSDVHAGVADPPVGSPESLMSNRFATGVPALIALSCALVPLLFAAAMYITGDGLHDAGGEISWLWTLPPVLVSVVMGVWLVRRNPLSGWVRAAVLVPVLHLGLMALVWYLWRNYAGDMELAMERLPLVTELPAPQIALLLGGLVVLGALVPTGRRRRGRVPVWLRATVAFALAHVLLLGLWLPLASFGWDHLFHTHFLEAGWYNIAKPRAWLFAQIVLIPPTIGALLFAAFSTAWPERMRKLAGHGHVYLAVVLGVAVMCRLVSDFAGYLAYANLVHTLLADAVFCLMCVTALGLSHARVLFAAAHDAERPAPWVQRGVIESADGTEDEASGRLRFLGWLTGWRGSVRRFWLRTDQGLLEVPHGVRLVAPMPVSSTYAGVRGNGLDDDPERREHTVLRVGDEVVVSGYVEAPGDGVFRQHALPVPGADGLLVTRARVPSESVWRDVQLIMWRPCVLYLLVVATAALPGVVALALL